MGKDFYLDERALAAYFEKDWFDHVTEPAPFSFAPYGASQFYSDYHERLIELLAAKLGKTAPKTLLEVGSSLGRTFFEVCRKIKSVKSATLIEPSEHLAAGFDKIFSGGETRLETRPIRTACTGVEVSLIQSPFQTLKPLGTFDLVICSNVIDQCQDPEKLVELLKRAAAPNGVLALTCTYQWQTKYIGNATKQIQNINDLFGADWERLGEANIPFQVRANERHWLKFLSHALILRQIPNNL